MRVMHVMNLAVEPGAFALTALGDLANSATLAPLKPIIINEFNDIKVQICLPQSNIVNMFTLILLFSNFFLFYFNYWPYRLRDSLKS